MRIKRSKFLSILVTNFMNSVSGGILPKFKLTQAFMAVLVTCKNEKDPNKNKGSKVLTRFSPL